MDVSQNNIIHFFFSEADQNFEVEIEVDSGKSEAAPNPKAKELAAVVVDLRSCIRIVNTRKWCILGAARYPRSTVRRVRAEVGADHLLDGGRRRRRGRLDIADRVRKGIISEDPVDGSEKWVMLAAAPVGKVVQVQGPDHCPAESVVPDELRLLPDHFCVVEADPLETARGVGAHPLDVDVGVAGYNPALALDVVADLSAQRLDYLCFIDA